MTASSHFAIRAVRVADAAGVEAVRSAGWREAYRGLIDPAFLDTFYGDLERRRQALATMGPESVQVVAVDGVGAVVGWAGGGPSRDEDHAPLGIQELYSCYVAPAWWGSGVGGAILEHVVGKLASRGPRTTLWVLSGNARARRFYQAHGFTPDGAEKATSYPGAPPEMRYARPS